MVGYIYTDVHVRIVKSRGRTHGRLQWLFSTIPGPDVVLPKLMAPLTDWLLALPSKVITHHVVGSREDRR